MGGGEKMEEVDEAALASSHCATAEARAELLEEVVGRTGGPVIPAPLVTGGVAVVLEGEACAVVLAVALEVVLEVRVTVGVTAEVEVELAELMEETR